FSHVGRAPDSVRLGLIEIPQGLQVRLNLFHHPVSQWGESPSAHVHPLSELEGIGPEAVEVSCLIAVTDSRSGEISGLGGARSHRAGDRNTRPGGDCAKLQCTERARG